MYPILLIFLVILISSIIYYHLFVRIPRAKMLARAEGLEANNDFGERITVYLPLHGTFSRTKERQIEAKIAEMASDGWIYLKGSSAGLKTMKSWGGGIDLHFAKVKT